MNIKQRVKEIITKKGGFRELAILKTNPIINKIQWDNNYKVVELINPADSSDSCEIELVSGRITG